ncbi:DUF2867 domain-containing protein [Nocardia panacis]|uniref:DUF2867 domain-containing protein n=1 Tax=Nocardia panacis TaxID=2340916 RepID=A0A3A4K4K7_9NOCA|nr:DUF2867 domain-containing protein [Nocardia panacis]RJO73321.1 DUF2867 domain-containing protein [Nocardia panacis]
MTETLNVPELRDLLTGADHVDIKTAEADLTLDEFLAGMVGGDQGPLLRLLFRARGVLARALRLQHQNIPFESKVRPDEISYTPGTKIWIFTVVDGEPDRFLLMEAADTHLSGCLAVTVEPGRTARHRFQVATIVAYRHWTGPLYFNLIRPFHHLVVAAMVRRAARYTP